MTEQRTTSEQEDIGQIDAGASMPEKDVRATSAEHSDQGADKQAARTNADANAGADSRFDQNAQADAEKTSSETADDAKHAKRDRRSTAERAGRSASRGEQDTGEGTARISRHTRERMARDQGIVDEHASSDGERTDRTSAAQRGTRAQRGHNASGRAGHHSGNRNGSQEQAKRPFPVFKVALVAVIALIVIAAIQLFSTTIAVDITVNGEPLTVRGAKTLRVAIKDSGLPLNPGDLISLHGNVLEKGGGKTLTATINGKDVEDLDTALHNGDDIRLSDGGDIIEPFNERVQVVPYEVEDRGVGAFRMFENMGVEGAISIRTGQLSGETVSKQIFYPETLVYKRYNPDVGDLKIVALTFDDGPSSAYTPQILDVLKENDAVATFFVLGNSIQEIGNEWIVQRAADEGHQICSRTYDNAAMAGENINNLDAESQIAQIEDGRAAITQALGVEASRIVRVPNSNMTAETLQNLRDYIDVEVGWNVDSRDDEGIEAEYIAETLMDVTPGDIVLLHDGGGNREATIEALRIALPELKKQGWHFVTVDDLLLYPELK